MHAVVCRVLHFVWSMLRLLSFGNVRRVLIVIFPTSFVLHVALSHHRCVTQKHARLLAQYGVERELSVHELEYLTLL